MANISLSEMIAMASFLQQKRRSKKQQQTSQEPHKAKSVPVKGWGGGGKRSSSVNTAPRRELLSRISSDNIGRGSTMGASQQVTAGQKIRYMKAGLAAQEESAKRMRKAALDDMLEYQRVSDAQAGSGAISGTEEKMQYMIDLLRGQSTGGGGDLGAGGGDGKVEGNKFKGGGPFYRSGKPETFPVQQWTDELGMRHAANTGFEYYDFMTRKNTG